MEKRYVKKKFVLDDDFLFCRIIYLAFKSKWHLIKIRWYGLGGARSREEG